MTFGPFIMKLPATKMALCMRYDISVIILHLPVALYVSSDENVVQGVCVRRGVWGGGGQVGCRRGTAPQMGGGLGEGGGGPSGRWDGRSRVLGDRPSTSGIRFEPSCRVASNMHKSP